MPFEVTPFMPYLTRFGTDAKPVAASTNGPNDPASGANAPAAASSNPDQVAPAPTPQQ
jgi:hypothetical protein